MTRVIKKANRVPVISKLADAIIAFSSLFAIAMFIIVLVGFLNQWQTLIKGAVDVNSKLFWCGLAIAVIYSIVGFLSTFINGFAKTMRSLFSKKKQEVKPNGI